MNNKGSSLTPAQALENSTRCTNSPSMRCAAPSVSTSKQGNFPTKGQNPGPFCLSIALCHRDGSASTTPKTRAYARFTHSGCYSTTVTRPALFRPYLEEQLTLLYQDYGAHIAVEPSQHEIPIRT